LQFGLQQLQQQTDDIRRRNRYMQQYNSGILHTINYYDQEDCVTGKEEEALDLLRMEVYFHSGMESKSHLREEFNKQKVTWVLGCEFSRVKK